MIYGNAVVIDGGEIALTAVIDGGEIQLSHLVDDGVQFFMPLNPHTYTGDTTVTPNEETQTLITHGELVTVDIIVNPIPSNYGLITYDGTKIIVS